MSPETLIHKEQQKQLKNRVLFSKKYPLLSTHFDDFLSSMEYPYFKNKVRMEITENLLCYGIYLFINQVSSLKGGNLETKLIHLSKIIVANGITLRTFYKNNLNIYDDYFDLGNKKDICGNLINYYISDCNMIINILKHIGNTFPLYSFSLVNFNLKYKEFISRKSIDNEEIRILIMGYATILIRFGKMLMVEIDYTIITNNYITELSNYFKNNKRVDLSRLIHI